MDRPEKSSKKGSSISAAVLFEEAFFSVWFFKNGFVVRPMTTSWHWDSSGKTNEKDNIYC